MAFSCQPLLFNSQVTQHFKFPHTNLIYHYHSIGVTSCYFPPFILLLHKNAILGKPTKFQSRQCVSQSTSFLIHYDYLRKANSSSLSSSSRDLILYIRSQLYSLLLFICHVSTFATHRTNEKYSSKREQYKIPKVTQLISH